MLEWLTANLGTILISAGLLVVVILIIRYLLRQKKAGKSSCGAGCAHCAMHGQCHSQSCKHGTGQGGTWKHAPPASQREVSL